MLLSILENIKPKSAKDILALKSSNYSLQKSAFSMYKHRELIKYMVLVVKALESHLIILNKYIFSSIETCYL